MRKILLKIVAVLVLCSTGMLRANPVTPKAAKAVAAKFGGINFGTKSSDKVLLAHTLKSSRGDAWVYVFNIPNGGFVVVAADDRAHPILGYSTNGQFDSNNIPDGLRYMLNVYGDEIAYAQDNNLEAGSEIAAEWKAFARGSKSPTKAPEVVVEAICETTWNQDDPYNYFCPEDFEGPGGRMYAGCVACAMSQIMKHWNWPEKGNGEHTSTGNPKLTVNFDTMYYQWDNMPANLRNAYWETDSVQIKAIAQLMYHAGVSVDMNYGAGGSGALSETVPDALRIYFGYERSELLYRYDYSLPTWISMLKSTLDRGWPIYYSGADPDPDGGGHAFVCDGYNTANQFHFNWGWGGHGDGFYQITALTPGNFHFNIFQDAIMDIRKPDAVAGEPLLTFYSTTTSMLNAGEELEFDLEMRNVGTAASNTRTPIKIATNSPNISIECDTASVPPLEIGQTESCLSHFKIRANSNATHFDTANLQVIALNDTSYFAITVTNYSIPGWIHYDESRDKQINEVSLGFPDETFYWGIKIPKKYLNQGSNVKITKVKVFDAAKYSGKLFIRQGEEEPDTVIYEQTFKCRAKNQELDIDLEEEVSVDTSKNLWVILHNTAIGDGYVASVGNYQGTPNGSWISSDGKYWSIDNYTWNIRAYFDLDCAKPLLNVDPTMIDTLNVQSDSLLYITINNDGDTLTTEPITVNISTNDKYVNLVDTKTTIVRHMEPADCEELEFKLNFKNIEKMPSPHSVNANYRINTGNLEFTGKFKFVLKKSNPTSILLNQSNLRVYPNPSTGIVNIAGEEIINVQISNVLGHTLLQQKVNATQHAIDLSGYAPGVYFIIVDTPKGRVVKQISLQ